LKCERNTTGGAAPPRVWWCEALEASTAELAVADRSFLDTARGTESPVGVRAEFETAFITE